MAVTLDEVRGFLDAKLKYTVFPEIPGVRLSFNVEGGYKDTDGDAVLTIAINLDEKGELLSFRAQRIYSYPEGEHAPSVMAACLYAAYLTKVVQYEFDPSDGEIAAVADLPIEDGKVTSKQFHRYLKALIETVKICHPMIAGAMESGKIEAPPELREAPAAPDLTEALKSVPPEILAGLMEQFRKLAESAGKKPDERPVPPAPPAPAAPATPATPPPDQL